MQDRDLRATRYAGVFYRMRIKTGDKIYYVNFADADGKRHWRAVGKHSEGMRPAKAAAIRASLNGCAEIPSGASIRQARQRSAYTLGRAVEEYAAHAAANGAFVDRPLGQYALHCKALVHDAILKRFDVEQAEALKHELERSGLAAQSVCHALSFLRRAVHYAMARGLCDRNPFSVRKGGVFQLPKLDNARLRYFTPDEARRLLEELRARSPQLFQMALLSLRTGLRATEIFSLKREDLDAAASILHIRSKGGRREVVYLDSEMLAMLQGIPDTGSEWLFPDQFGKRHTRIPSTFGRVVTQLGMQKSRHSLYRVSFHTFRHTFASWLAQSGTVTLLELMKLMRHRSLVMTQRYAHLIPSELYKKTSIIADALNGAPLSNGD